MIDSFEMMNRNNKSYLKSKDHTKIIVTPFPIRENSGALRLSLILSEIHKGPSSI